MLASCGSRVSKSISFISKQFHVSKTHVETSGGYLEKQLLQLYDLT